MPKTSTSAVFAEAISAARAARSSALVIADSGFVPFTAIAVEGTGMSIGAVRAFMAALREATSSGKILSRARSCTGATLKAGSFLAC